MSVTVISLRQLHNKPSVPAYPGATNYTLYAQDLNAIRSALMLGDVGIFTQGLKVAEGGFEIASSAPFLMSEGATLQFRNQETAWGYLTYDGELAMRRLVASSELVFKAGSAVTLEGAFSFFIPVVEQANIVTYRDDAEIVNLDVFRNADTHVLHFLAGSYVADSIGSGFAMRNSTKVSRISMDDNGNLVLEDAVDINARPVAWSNQRIIAVGIEGEDAIQEIIGIGGVSALQIESSPRTYQISLETAGVKASHLSLGVADGDVNIDAMHAMGAAFGSVVTAVTVEERAAISELIAAVAGLQAEILLRPKYFRVPGGDDVYCDANGRIDFVNSSSVNWDAAGASSIRAIASGGGGGGGGGVNSITWGLFLGNLGSSENPQPYVKIGTGLANSGGLIVPDWGTGTNNVSRGDHDHAGVYSPIGHTHASYAAVSQITYETLDANGDVGTGSGQLAAGSDARFHTRNADLGTTGLSWIIRHGYAAAPDASSYALRFERGSGTDFQIVFNDSDDTLKAGFVGSELAFIFEGDARLADARDPLPHDLSSHSGSVLGSQVQPLYAPTRYTPTGPTLEGHLEGVNTALAATGAAQSMVVSGDTNEFIPGSWVLGTGVSGVRILQTGTITRCVMNAQAPLAPASSLLFMITNITKATSVAVSMAAGDMSKVSAIALAVDAGDEVGVVISAVAGVPNAGIITLNIMKE